AAGAGAVVEGADLARVPGDRDDPPGAVWSDQPPLEGAEQRRVHGGLLRRDRPSVGRPGPRSYHQRRVWPRPGRTMSGPFQALLARRESVADPSMGHSARALA